MPDLEDILKTKELLDDLAGSIRHILLSKFPSLSASEREDIEQEVKLKLCRAVAHGKKITHLRSYLWKAVLTTALDALDKRGFRLSLSDIPEEAEGDGSKEVRRGDRKLWLDKAVQELSPRRQLVVSLYLKGKSLPRIAGETSWSENTVRHLLYRGLSDLKTKLARTENIMPARTMEGGGEE